MGGASRAKDYVQARVHWARAIHMNDDAHRNRRDSYLVLGAIFTIIAGVLSLINGVEGLIAGARLVATLPSVEVGLYPICGILSILFGAIAIASALYALSPRPRATPLLLGAVLGMLAGGVYGFLLGFGAILLYWKANLDL